MRVQVTVTYETTAYATVEVEVANTHTNTIQAALTDDVLADANWQISDGNIIRPADVAIMDDSLQVLDFDTTPGLGVVVTLERIGAREGEQASDFIGRFETDDIASAFLSLSATIDPEALALGRYGIEDMEPGEFCNGEPVIYTTTDTDSPRRPSEAVILRRLDETEADAEVGPMYRILLGGGIVVDAFGDELKPIATELPDGIDI